MTVRVLYLKVVIPKHKKIWAKIRPNEKYITDNLFPFNKEISHRHQQVIFMSNYKEIFFGSNIGFKISSAPSRDSFRTLFFASVSAILELWYLHTKPLISVRSNVKYYYLR